MPAGALDSWLQAWRDAHPQCETAWVFLHDRDRAVFGALAALEQEWLDAACAIAAPQVAATKLQWWREELLHARAGSPRHPLTRALFADARATAVPAPCWGAAIEAAALQLDATTAADFTAQLEQARSLQGALARLETVLWFGVDADPARAQLVATVQYLIDALRHPRREAEHGRSPLPMSLLARHGLSVATLSEDSPALRAATRDQTRELLRALAEAQRSTGPLALFRDLQARLDRRALRHSIDAEDPSAALRNHPGGWRTLLDAWRAARAWHAAVPP